MASAREAQAGRAALNARLGETDLARVAAPDEAGAALLLRAAEQLEMSARSYTRSLRVARTIADLEGSEGVRRPHVAEAISFRRRDPAASGAPRALSA